jgi:hypothetical protein
MEIILFATASRQALGPTQPPIQLVSGTHSLGVKRPGREADHALPSSSEFKNAWNSTSTPPCVFMAWCLVKYRMSSWHGTWLSPGTTYLYLTTEVSILSCNVLNLKRQTCFAGFRLSRTTKFCLFTELGRCVRACARVRNREDCRKGLSNFMPRVGWDILV